MYRLHLYDGSITEWFPPSEIEEWETKYKGRIVAIGIEDEYK